MVLHRRSDVQSGSVTAFIFLENADMMAGALPNFDFLLRY